MRWVANDGTMHGNAKFWMIVRDAAGGRAGERANVFVVGGGG